MVTPRPLIDYFKLHDIGNNTFRTLDPIIGFRGPAYGGHLLSVAAKAAVLTVPQSNCLINSVHSCYIKHARPDTVTYEVTKTKDGQVFTQRDVLCKQDDKRIFNCSVNFTSPDSEAAHMPYNRDTKPSVPGPNDPVIASTASRYYIYKLFSKLVESFPLHFGFIPPQDDCTSDAESFFKPREPKFLFWAKSKEPFDSQSQNEHRIGLVFASDAVMPGSILSLYPRYKFGLVTSLNHSIWFENNVDINQWHLFNIECLSSKNGANLSISRIFQEDGTLVATAVQQGYIRGAKL